jgi:hypothetical protein
MHTLPSVYPPLSVAAAVIAVVAAAAAAFELFAFPSSPRKLCSCLFFPSYYPRRTSPSSTRLSARSPRADALAVDYFYTFRSQVSFSPGRIIRLKIGTLAEKRIEKSSLTKKKKRKRKRKKNAGRKRNIFFNFLFRPNGVPVMPPPLPGAKSTCSILLNRCARARALYIAREQSALYNIYLWTNELNIFSTTVSCVLQCKKRNYPNEY